MTRKEKKFNLQISKADRILSQKLFVSFDDEKCHLNYQYFCFQCKGIGINPLNCIECGVGYCENCLEVIPESKLICYCKNTSKTNFQHLIKKALDNTFYFIKDTSGSENKQQISYIEALSCKDESKNFLIPSENGVPLLEETNNYNTLCIKTNAEVSKHKKEFIHPLTRKVSRIINFNYIKGYNLTLYQKVLEKNNAFFL